MILLVDTPVWSELLRRKNPNPDFLNVMAGLMDKHDVYIIGPVRQEVLTGIKDEKLFRQVSKALEGTLDLPLPSDIFVLGAAYHNRCSASGIQGSATDFLICAAAHRYGASIFTLDQDFERYAEVLPIKLYKY